MKKGGRYNRSRRAPSSVGRAAAPHAAGHRFKSCGAHQICPRGGTGRRNGPKPRSLRACEFDSRRGHQKRLLTAERANEIFVAAETSQVIEFKNGIEARLYRECFIRTHMGVIDIKEDRRQLPGRA